MGKLAFRLLLIIVAAAVVSASRGLLWAQPPEIHIDLILDKSSYAYGEPVGVEVVVRNQSGRDLLISKGFRSKVFYLEMRVIDPAGRLLLARRDEPHDEFPDAPPLAFALYEGRPVRVAACEVLPIDWEGRSQTEDLRAHYALELPGYCSAQVQLSAMTFDEPPCEADTYAWQGVLKSETKYFYVQGRTKGVRVIPNQWHLSWKEDDKKAPDVQVQIWPEEGETASDYDTGSIRLNNVAARRVEILPPMLKVFFNPKEVMESLGDVEVGQWYSVLVSGRLKSGQPFGGEQEVRVVR
jgi:hypothetical protein